MFFFFSILFSTLLFVKILLWKIPFFPFFLSFSSSSSFSVFKKSKKKKKIYWFGYYNNTAVCLCVKGLLASVAFILCKFLFFCFFLWLLLPAFAFFFFAWFDNQKPTTNSIRQLKAVNQSKVATAAVRGWRRCTKGKTRREEIDRSKKKKKGVQDGISTTYVNCWLGKINKKEQKKKWNFSFFFFLFSFSC